MALDIDMLDVDFEGELFQWRGPAPYFYITVPDDASAAIRAISSIVTYGWGVIPVKVWIGGSRWETSLFPKDGRYLVPIKAAIRRAERLEEGDSASVRLVVGR
jgi:hypothetical protein